jgi:Nitrate and nitrite sensing
MPEELRDLMDRATEGPVPPVDADDVWKRGSRQRRTRAVLYAAPIVVLVLLVAGLAVVAIDNDGGGDDTTVAELTPEEQSVVDDYLGVLERAGVLAGFPDERAAVEYALRVDCFGVVSPEQLDQLGAATTDVVTALTAEGVASAALYYDVGSDAAVAAARDATDTAVSALQATASELEDAAESDAPLAEVLETATVRFEDLPTIRQAIDDRQMAGVNAGDQLTASGLAAIDVLSGATALTGGSESFREWDAQATLLHGVLSQVDTSFVGLGAASGIGPDIDQLSEDPRNIEATLSQLVPSVALEDDARARWDEVASRAMRVALRNATSTQEVRTYESLLDAVVGALQSGDVPEVEPAALSASGQDKLEALTSVADAAVDEATSGDSATSELDAAVSDACDATDDAILGIEPAAVEQ